MSVHDSSTSNPPSGATFHRCALQVNPRDYGQIFRGQTDGEDEHSYAAAIVARAVANGVSVLAITNHNDVRAVPIFQAAVQHTEITVFPGFELASSEGIHTLCIYSPETDQDRLERFLGEFGIDRPGPSADLSNKKFEEILATVRHRGGVAIAAHVTSDSGLFKVLTGQARVKAWRCTDLLAIQIPRTVDDLAQDVRQIVRNKNPDYRRDHPADNDLALTTLNARDITRPEDVDDPSATCWIKMSEVTIEGLRQAFLDPRSRVRLNSDDQGTEEHSELLSLAWQGGFLDGVRVRLNPNLNVLIGGRGAGKSTVIESLRYVLGMDPIGEEAQKAHRGIVGHVLRGGTRISLRVRCHRPAEREYEIQRTVPNPPVVRSADGQISNLPPGELLPHLEVYGQHEIAELTRDRETLTRLLDRFVQHDASMSRQKTGLRRELEKIRRSILDVQTELQQVDERLATLPRLEETLARFQEAGIEDRLREQSLLIREERVLETIPERLRTFHECLDLLRRETPIDLVFVSPEALKELPGRAILAEANDVLERLSSSVEQTVGQLDRALGRTHEELAKIKGRWEVRKRQVHADYEKILRQLQRSAVDGAEFIRLRRQIETLRPLRERRAVLRRSAEELLARRRSLLVDWEDLRAEEFRRLDRAAKKVSRSLKGRVQVDVTAEGNREPLFILLRSGVGGQLSNTIEKLRAVDSISLASLAHTCRRGPDELRAKYGLTPTQARNIVDAGPEIPMRIEELDLPSTTAIQLNTAPSGEPPSWQTLEELSKGQKATAVLLLLLLDSDAPLVVDQPEDDLDNRFITDVVVPRMRTEKRRRQFMFSTHNANIPVLGDAELILGLTAKGEASDGLAQIKGEHLGSIDTPSVRGLVEDLLEGGRYAFETRRLKYGF